MRVAAINNPAKWGKWKCPACEIWCAPPRTTICSWCQDKKDEAEEAAESAQADKDFERATRAKCQECGGTTAHIGDCSLMLIPAAKPSEFPCIVCGGERAHIRVGSEVICQKFIKARKCDLDLALRIASAQERIQSGRIH